MAENNFIEQFQEYMTVAGKSAHTIRAYSQDLQTFIRWFELSVEEPFTPRAVDPGDLHDYKNYLIGRGRRPATTNRRLKALVTFFRWAKRRQLVADNPFEIVEAIFVKEQKDISPHWLERQEQRAIIRAARESGSKRDLAIIQTLLGTGLRLSELAALRVDDLDLGERRGRLQVRIGKGGKARTIPLDGKTRQALESYLSKREKDGSKQLFLGQRGPLNQAGINYLVSKYAYQAKLEDCTPHTLRHSFAKNLVDAGIPLDQVASLLGHESLDTTRIYTRPSQRDLERAVRKAAGEL